MALLDDMEQLDLLLRLKVSEEFPMNRPARLVDGRESFAIRFLEILKGAAQLAIDVVDDSCPRGAGILVRRNNLIRDCC